MNVIVSHPTYMKDVILEQGTNMLNLYLRPRQQIEAQLKQETTTGDQTSYIPGSLQINDSIKLPNYLKGINTLQELVGGSHESNETIKEKNALIALYMTWAVIREKSATSRSLFQRSRRTTRTPISCVGTMRQRHSKIQAQQQLRVPCFLCSH